MAITVKKIEADGFVIEMTADGCSLSVQVSVPKRQGDRIFSDAEREKMAKHKALDAALDFAEALSIRTPPIPTPRNKPDHHDCTGRAEEHPAERPGRRS